jgi:hypothetical protein
MHQKSGVFDVKISDNHFTSTGGGAVPWLIKSTRPNGNRAQENPV